MLGAVVEEADQRLGVVGDRLGPLGPVVADQRLDCPLGAGAVLGPDNLLPCRPGHPRGRFSATHQHVWHLMHPAALLGGGGEHLPQRRPQPQRTVTDHDRRRPHAMAAQIT